MKFSLIAATLSVLASTASAQIAQYLCQNQQQGSCIALYTCQTVQITDNQSQTFCSFSLFDNQCTIVLANVSPKSGITLGKVLEIVQLNPSSGTDILAEWEFSGTNYTGAAGQLCGQDCAYTFGTFPCQQLN